MHYLPEAYTFICSGAGHESPLGIVPFWSMHRHHLVSIISIQLWPDEIIKTPFPDSRIIRMQRMQSLHESFDQVFRAGHVKHYCDKPLYILICTKTRVMIEVG